MIKIKYIVPTHHIETIEKDLNRKLKDNDKIRCYSMIFSNIKSIYFTHSDEIVIKFENTSDLNYI